MKIRRMLAVALLLALTRPVEAQLPKATSEEETTMTGRLSGAIEDVGGGFTGEALQRFARINKELKRREYSLRNRWAAHYWYGRLMVDVGKPQDALSVLTMAEQEARGLTDREQATTAKLVTEANEKASKKRQ